MNFIDYFLDGMIVILFVLLSPLVLPAILIGWVFSKGKLWSQFAMSEIDHLIAEDCWNIGDEIEKDVK